MARPETSAALPSQAVPIIPKALTERLREVANAQYHVDGPAPGGTWVDPEEITDDDLRATADHLAAIENPESRRDAMLEVLTSHRLALRNNNKLAREFLKYLDGREG